MRLYEIAAALEAALEIDEETGEILPGSEERLEALTLTRDQKATDIACLVLSLDAEETAIREQAKKLTERARIVAKRAEWLRLYLAQWLPDGEKISDARVLLRVTKARAVEILDEDKIPTEYMVAKFSPDKKSIKAAHDAGKDVPGARVVEKKHVTIR